MKKIASHSVGIVGSGLGGLASACTLAARGHQVVVYEANGWTGGKAAVHEDSGYRFDMGPTILTMPSVLRRIFGESGTRVEDVLELVRLDPQWRSFFEDGSVLDLFQDVEEMAKVIDGFAGDGVSGKGYKRFQALSREQAEISERWFFWKPIGRLMEMFRPQDMFKASALRDVLNIRPGVSVARTLRSYVPDARVSQMLDHFTQYVGSSPEQSPAVLCSIAHMQAGEGVWYPMGGISRVPAALRAHAEKLGVRFEAGREVVRIEVEAGAVSGVVLEAGEVRRHGVVVSNMDSVRTHRQLIGGAIARRFEGRREYEPACSGVVLYLGLRKRYEHLAHHNFVFSRDPHEEFEAIYRRGEPAPDPTAYLAAPAGTDPSVAPDGGEALYVLVHAPYLRPGQDWKQMLPEYRQRILDKLKRTGGMEDIEERIVTERVLTPQDIHDRYRVLNGAIYGLASHGLLSGAIKPSNRSPDVRGLYLAGGSAHPGPGMPMALMSGWIAADVLHQDAVEGAVDVA